MNITKAYLFYSCLFILPHFVDCQQSHLNRLNDLLGNYLLNPNYNPHTRTGNCATNYTIDCGTSYSGSNDLIISNFNPIRSVVKGNPITQNFSTITSYSKFGEDKEFEINYQSQHFRIPSNELDQQDLFFKFEFELQNQTFNDKLYYVIFYQNETYKHSSTVDCELVFKSGENFYGSWGYQEGINSGLREINVTPFSTETHEGYFRIRGNPRNEQLYFSGTNTQYENWQDQPTGNEDWRMNRWGRVPRMGDYKFILIVTSNKDFFDDKQFLVDVTKPYVHNNNSAFISPFQWQYIASRANSNADLNTFLNNTSIIESCTQLTLKAKPDLSTPLKKNSHPISPFEVRTNANSANQVVVQTVPILKGFDDFTQLEYNWNTHFYDPKFTREEEFIDVLVDSDPEQDNSFISTNSSGDSEIHIVNPKSTSCTDPHREHAGINYHRLKYGKFRGEIKFPNMFTKHNIWKGINNTYWLSRNTGGFIVGQDCMNSENSHHESDIEFFPYSENGNNYYPSGINNDYDYDPQKQLDVNKWDTHPKEGGKSALVISNFDYNCTNLKDPIPLGNTIITNFEGKNFAIRRDEIKTVIVDVNDFSLVPLVENSFFDHPVYYEIEWKPTEIIYRIGDSWSNLTTVGYFNSDFTLIPNIPMSLIIAQHQLSTFDNPDTPEDESGQPNNFNAHHHKFIPLWNEDIIGRVINFSVE